MAFQIEARLHSSYASIGTSIRGQVRQNRLKTIDGKEEMMQPNGSSEF